MSSIDDKFKKTSMIIPTLTLPIRRTTPFSPPDFYAELRENDPISRVALPDGSIAWLIARYEDVRDALKNTALSSNPRQLGFPEPELSDRPLFLTEMDAPRHTALRRILASEFSPGRISLLADKVQRDTDHLVDIMLSRGKTADIVRDYALPIPSLTICHLLGVPYEDHAFFQKIVKSVMSLDDEIKSAAFGEIYAYMERLVSDKEISPTNDLIGRLVIEQLQTNSISHDELLNIAVILLMAGFETTATMISLGIATLFHFPDQLRLLRDDLNRTENAIEELLRFHTVGDADGLRVATVDTKIGGQKIAKGEGVIPLAWSANRDPSIFSDPDRLDICRELHGQLAFGHGVHQCIGLNLARMEMRIALRTLLDRIPTLSLAVPVAALPFQYQSELFGLDALPVKWS